MDFLPAITGGENDESKTNSIEMEVMDNPLDEDEVFEEPKEEPIKVKPIKKKVTISEKVEEKELETIEPEKKKSTRQPLSDARKAALAEGRRKSLENRKAKAIEKKQLNDLKQQNYENKLSHEIAIQQEIKESREKMKKKEEPVEEPIVKQESSLSKIQEKKYYSQKDLDEISMNAIEKYDTIRKARKQDKQKAKDEKKQKDIERENLMRLATRSTSHGINPQMTFWDNCY